MTPIAREAVVLDQCLELLKIRNVFHWRQNVGGMELQDPWGHLRYVRFGQPGISDILAILPRHSQKPGVLLALEVKRPGGKTTAAQDRFLQNVRDQGGEAHVIDDVVKLDELLTDLGC